jgi:predicted DNA-binding transcriptional regulator AlpA
MFDRVHWWTTQDVASFLGIAPSTVRAYIARDQMPKPHRRMGRMTLWLPQTVRTWNASRPSEAGREDRSDR